MEFSVNKASAGNSSSLLSTLLVSFFGVLIPTVRNLPLNLVIIYFIFYNAFLYNATPIIYDVANGTAVIILVYGILSIVASLCVTYVVCTPSSHFLSSLSFSYVDKMEASSEVIRKKLLKFVKYFNVLRGADTASKFSLKKVTVGTVSIMTAADEGDEATVPLDQGLSAQDIGEVQSLWSLSALLSAL